MIICDLHTHSTSSDGYFSPSEVVKKAYAKNVKYLALTDHDTLSGIDEAKETASKLDLTFIPGIELSTTFNKDAVHILGFFKGDDYKSEELNAFLSDLKNKRVERAKEICYRLKKYNDIDIKFEDVLKNGKDTIARPHIAKAIIDAGYNYDINYIFDNIIGNHCPSFVPSTKIPTEEGIELLKKYNALVFIAHPVLLKKVSVEELIPLGFDGIEAVYPLNKEEDTKKFISIAEKNNLLISCGSDSHGLEDKDPKHGLLGSMKMNEYYMQAILNKLSK